MANIMRLGGGGGGAQLAVTLNDDGTQNLSILDDGKVFDLPSLTADADATPEDVAEGKVFYAKGYRYVGTGGGEPVLLWANSDPTSAFPAQTVSINLAEYDGVLIEARASSLESGKDTSISYVQKGVGDVGVSVTSFNKGASLSASYGRYATVTDVGVTFSGGYITTSAAQNIAYIPTRIWGVKFTI